MDFFQAQESAKSRTRLLIVLFAAALVGIILSVYIAITVALAAGGVEVAPFDPVLLLGVAAGVGVLVGGGSTYRTLQLRSGGGRVAELLGGRRVWPNTVDPAERRLVHVVEEMAIASGTPVPAIYVLDHEPAINAFAAGYTIHDAAVAVTRGALDRLTRDELQGVIAHEFSHILNGDMRLNIRMIGLLFGILLLSVVGRTLLRGGRFTARGRRGGGQIALVGVALMLIGFVGLFFGRLIKAAVSRQREYLADAAAVQFTRNPDGIAGALKKIGAAHAVGGSRIRDAHAEELSHLFFAEGLSLSALFATHPPLPDRIRRIQPGWDGTFPELEATKVPATAEAPSRPRGSALRAVAAGELVVGAAAIMESIGSPGPAHVEHAARLLEAVPRELRDAAHDEDGAQALVFAMLRSRDPAVARSQLETVRRYGGEEVARRFAAWDIPAELRLPLLDLALPSLRGLSDRRSAAFRDAVHRLVAADGRASLFEFALVQILDRQLEWSESREARRDEGAIHSLAPLRDDVERVLSAVAHSGAADEPAARAAFAAGAALLPSYQPPWRLLSPAEIGGTRELAGALASLRRGSRGVRRRFLDACAHCIAHDGRVRTAEAELFRAIAESLDAPTPPVVG